MAAEATATLAWTAAYHPRLKLKALDGAVVLNEEFPTVALPDNLTILDIQGDEITGSVSFTSIHQNYFILRDAVRYRFAEPVPPPPQQQPSVFSPQHGDLRKRRSVEWAFSVPQLRAREDHLLYGREDAKDRVIQYLAGCRDRTPECYDTVSKKFSMLGTSGVKGIGKTELQAQICAKWAKEALGRDTATLYVSYNGGGKAGAYCQNFSTMASPLIDSLGHLLLVSCGMEESGAKKMNIETAIAHIRQKMQCPDDACFVICVDEIIELDLKNRQGNGITEMSMAQHMMSQCMNLQDSSEGKVIFIFNAILDSMFTRLKSLSGRAIRALPLNMIPLHLVFSGLLSAKLKTLAGRFPAVHQLVLSCAGHPRATVDGLPLATVMWDEGSADISTAATVRARNSIVETCKFDITYLNEDIIQEWFAPVGLVSEDRRRDLLEKGILHSVSDKVEFLFPLLVQEWAYQHQNDSAYGQHLNGLFDADLIVDQNTEKFMEAVMYHYEAVLRKSLKGTEFSLKSFYKSEHIGSDFQNMLVKARIPGDQETSLVQYVADFTDTEYIRRLLDYGYIVVSKKHSERGIEYLAPYHDCFSTLVVACVQCKFVKEKAKWKEIQSQMAVAVDGFDKNKVAHFPVVYTTADQYSIQRTTSRDGVYFIESDIFAYTRRLGILRLHTQKLGSVLEDQYSFLRSFSDCAL